MAADVKHKRILCCRQYCDVILESDLMNGIALVALYADGIASPFVRH